MLDPINLTATEPTNMKALSTMNSPDADSNYFKRKIRTVRDWPRRGVNFRDITTLFLDPGAFARAVDVLATENEGRPVDIIAAVDARGFAIGGALAHRLRKPLVLVRKKGKLPFRTISASYELEYGSAAVEIHVDCCKPGERVLIVDDLIATGGTLCAAAKLFRELGGVVAGVAALVDLVELGGSRKLREAGVHVRALCEFTENE